ncbi:MAG TPA: SRPBCC family protein [Chloroflexia bacterium]|nr:SRPBCC family protein [Chloroflexia bacterium]
MNRIRAEAAEIIAARPETIYAILADYRRGHPQILPKAYFAALDVEAGGQGAGTVVNVRMQVMGVAQDYHLTVSEPEPGRVLVESDPQRGVVTTFTVTPVAGGLQAHVRIATEMPARPGVTGLVEKLVNPPVMRRIFRKQLRQLADYVAGARPAGTGR